MMREQPRTTRGAVTTPPTLVDAGKFITGHQQPTFPSGHSKGCVDASGNQIPILPPVMRCNHRLLAKDMTQSRLAAVSGYQHAAALPQCCAVLRKHSEAERQMGRRGQKPSNQDAPSLLTITPYGAKSREAGSDFGADQHDPRKSGGHQH